MVYREYMMQINRLFFYLPFKVIEIPFKGLHLQDVEAAGSFFIDFFSGLPGLLSELFDYFLLPDYLLQCGSMLGAQIVFVLLLVIQDGFQ